MAEKSICSIAGCDKHTLARGWCRLHYYRWYNKGDPAYKKPVKICAAKGCGRPSYSLGFCPAHYERFRRHGTPEGGRVSNGVPAEWIFSTALPYMGTECLEWPFAKYQNGYGLVRHDGRNTVASRFICMLAHGEPPTEFHEAAHTCGKGHLGCVNPRHLSWKTKIENEADKKVHGTR